MMDALYCGTHWRRSRIEAAKPAAPNILRATVRVTFWGALAMALTAGIGKIFGTVV